jgi:hypothetical protein
MTEVLATSNAPERRTSSMPLGAMNHILSANSDSFSDLVRRVKIEISV